ncbi:thiamine pyrophosphate-dependent enzyme [Microbacterium sp. Mu-80]|uniref:Thiamine pyrophosphate-dependent enzyme n=1 Tax=Microbacterium bandirmense TaxID=3122050 RepID=A0ABU8LG48_9MICO
MTVPHVGSAIVEALIDGGVEWASCVPGESFLPVIDGFREHADDARLVTFRHEASAVQAAVAHGRRTGRAGVCLVTRGPGALHAAIGVHSAEQDAAPLLLLVGQIASGDRGRGAFQEISSGAVFGSMSKWVASIDTAERARETILRALRIAESGRPGPVVVELPEDILYHPAVNAVRAQPVRLEDVTSPAVVAEIVESLEQAAKPLVLLGRGSWDTEHHRLVQEFAEANDVPVVAAFRCQDGIDNDSTAYIGHLGFGTDPALARTVGEADLVIALGGHFGDIDTDGYERPVGAPGARIIHVAASEQDVERVWPADVIAILPTLNVLRDLAAAPIAEPRWSAWASAARADLESFSTPAPDDVVAHMVHAASALVPEETIVCNGAGNYAVWVHRFHRYRTAGSQSAPVSGAMGFGLPAGIAATLSRPDTTTLVYAGDGCFLMSVAEMATVATNDLPVIIVVFDNGLYGTIRTHQDRRFPGNAFATDLGNPDFVSLAESFGITASRAETVEEFEEALRTALDSRRAHLIHVPTSGGPLTPLKASAA